MKILAGKWKGQTLHGFRSPHIRPMTARVKSCVFNTLYSYFAWDSQKVLDLFSGTGSLAFEALSRGASTVSLVDSHTKSIQVIKKNKQLLHINQGVKIYNMDVFRFLAGYPHFRSSLKGLSRKGLTHSPSLQLKKQKSSLNERGDKELGFSLIFADPPFQKKWGTAIVNSVRSSMAGHDKTILVLEISLQEERPPSDETMYLFTIKTFGDKQVLFYQLRKACL